MAATREQFRAELAQGIGGSSVGSLLSEVLPVEYGCKRQLWYKLSGTAPDYPEAESEPMMLGTLLEPWVARAYSDITGRPVSETGLKKHIDHPSLQVHVDRLIDPAPGDTRSTQGVLEIKAIGREMMRKVQDDGLPLDYILQLNHGMLCHGLQWGAFAVAVREDMLPLVALELAARVAGEPVPVFPRRTKILHFEMERSPEFCAAIEEEGPKFWATLRHKDQMPVRLDPEDPRCGRCQYRNQCQGAALMEGIEPEVRIPRRADLEPLVNEYRINTALLEECKALVKTTEEKFREALGTTTAAKAPVEAAGRIEWKNVIWRLRKGAERFDSRTMAVSYDLLRRTLIEHKIPGAELAAPSSSFIRTGIATRPLLLSALLPEKAKSKGEVPETDEE